MRFVGFVWGERLVRDFFLGNYKENIIGVKAHCLIH